MLRVLAIAVAVLTVAEARHQRIVGGTDANITDFPWQVSISHVTDLICGGTIVSSTWMLTAASCVHGIAQSNISIRAGSRDSHSGGNLFQASTQQLQQKFIT